MIVNCAAHEKPVARVGLWCGRGSGRGTVPWGSAAVQDAKRAAQRHHLETEAQVPRRSRLALEADPNLPQGPVRCRTGPCRQMVRLVW